MAKHPGFRIFVLGAGFSKPAGLPIASELFPAVREAIERRRGTETKFHRDLDEYLEYCARCGLGGKDRSAVDLEKWLSFLDLEHFMELRGSDTWSQEGNEAQILIRRALGEVIHLRTPDGGDLPRAYHMFAENLAPNDVVLTFNYDLVLERAMSHVGRRFRRFPNRYKSVDATGGIVDDSHEEVQLFKLHGSVDWFDSRPYERIRAGLLAQGASATRIHTVFDEPTRYGLQPLAPGLQIPSDPIRYIHEIRDPDSYYRNDVGFNAPFILSPSYVKFVYANPLLSLWNGLGRAGGFNLGLSVVGFSLPEHDEHIRVALYKMLDNYWSWWDDSMLGVLKDFARFVDYRPDDNSRREYEERFAFTDRKRSRYWYEGFNEEAVDFLFGQPRSA